MQWHCNNRPQRCFQIQHSRPEWAHEIQKKMGHPIRRPFVELHFQIVMGQTVT